MGLSRRAFGGGLFLVGGGGKVGVAALVAAAVAIVIASAVSLLELLQDLLAPVLSCDCWNVSSVVVLRQPFQPSMETASTRNWVGT